METERKIARIEIHQNEGFDALAKLIEEGWHILQINDLWIPNQHDPKSFYLLTVYHLTKEIEIKYAL